MRNFELELVNYKKPEVTNTSFHFIRFFSVYSGIFGVDQWGRSLVHLAQIIDAQQSQSMSLRAEGIEVTFSGFPRVVPCIRGESIVYQAREPRFTVIDYALAVSPRARTRILEMTKEICEEMERNYGMKFEKDPPTLIFPKENYAEEITHAEAVLLSSG